MLSRDFVVYLQWELMKKNMDNPFVFNGYAGAEHSYVKEHYKGCLQRPFIYLYVYYIRTRGLCCSRQGGTGGGQEW